MIDLGDPRWWTSVLPVLAILAMSLALVIVLKAVRAYRQNDDRAMLLLAVGLFLLVLAPLPAEVTALLFFEGSVEAELAADVARQLFRIAGLASILASMYVRR